MRGVPVVSRQADEAQAGSGLNRLEIDSMGSHMGSYRQINSLQFSINTANKDAPLVINEQVQNIE